MFARGLDGHHHEEGEDRFIIVLDDSCLALALAGGLAPRARGLSMDGVLLLSFKYSVTSDPLRALDGWSYGDDTPCSWPGVTCGTATGNDTAASSRVVGLSLRGSRLTGSIPSDMGMLKYLRTLDLSNNSLNATLPDTLFDAAELRVLDLSDNRVEGPIPAAIGLLGNLQLLNLSYNALTGSLPANLTALTNLTVVSLENNYLTGNLPGGFDHVEVLDLSSNLINGSLPENLGGEGLQYLNVSHNRLSGEIPAGFGGRIPANATLDFSYNELAGEIPESVVWMNQDEASFSGNPDLCGIQTRNPCPIPSSPSFSPPNVSAPTSPPAFAAFPKTIGSTPETTNATASKSKRQTGLRPVTIVVIVVGDIAGIAMVAAIFVCVCRIKKRKKSLDTAPAKNEPSAAADTWSSTSSESRGFTRWSCLRKRGDNDGESSETTASDTDDNDDAKSYDNTQRLEKQEPYKEGMLVTIDNRGGGGGGDKVAALELETLLKASAYILGATGSSIMYKAVLEDGTTLAVRRIGESGAERFKDFEAQVRAVAKLVHPNLVRVRGFYWGVDEKLIIYDFVPNGSLANARYRKVGSSPCHLPWEARLRIAKGVARGLAYLHEKKHVHGNLKPSNILLGGDMEPKIGDFGLERLVTGDTSYKAGGSARNFGSKRSTASRDSFQDLGPGPGRSPSPSPSSIGGISPYHAPESLRSLKPSPKWDVFAFGVVLLELLSGKVVAVDELGQANGVVVDDQGRAVRMADAAIRGELEGKEDALLACFRLGLGCASPVPQKRPSMKEALHVLEKIPSSSTSMRHYGGHLV
ncbi:LOW QUALITY PROTEIN: probable LRR receptor-like serine/threonine-protein kinase At4g37250 [Rhodamnia argentea]|uniref:LOW QUALITY PROTEIN: probable LRR receptor-like serine/threonine-protein kinase At4g37250 n=1 Tax=Rhodamnia argentea TaxID=178133 RepID=A0A8B8PBC0_9MYRT|nr:LOW QUALITY PROTEIN: probable LRR receptor-like serine/threonine-protein kinase At4g37250 [Rhodamnia argentea]